MKKIEISLQRKIAAVIIGLAITVITSILVFFICRDWLHMNSEFLRTFSCLVIAIPVGIISCKAIMESWTGEKIE
ncbi:MAG TPA: hypothetical protein IAC04_00355 [Candidatus Coprenecus stercoravium]|uniref:Uncharacterized protein n=1 Tax=Candidatus Coprenecus stercoravium TaxID=2840735 RepID=A0A9D2K814_9BACT|nr:hypothetical protein [Candidatus Coprenecus stercoravium]